MKKSLGQNFFVNKNLSAQIAEIVSEENPDLIVEIGPGPGAFTQFFATEEIKLLAIEKDDHLSLDLESRYPSITVKNIDFLDWDFSDLEPFKEERITFFGSLPYNVSKKIIKKIITSEFFNSPSFFIIQKEVAEKYCAKEPNNNFLSISTALYADTNKLFNISPESFKPRPNVNSTFIKFSPKSIPLEDTKAFEKFLHDAFRQPRKTLKNNFGRNYSFNTEGITPLLQERPQHLSLEQYLLLFNNLA
jgi:16S rRNA (adenine1518-N6/adenine1519-N6)-dimethyltransferase